MNRKIKQLQLIPIKLYSIMKPTIFNNLSAYIEIGTVYEKIVGNGVQIYPDTSSSILTGLKKKRNVASHLPHHNLPLVLQKLNPRHGHFRRRFTTKRHHKTFTFRLSI